MQAISKENILILCSQNSARSQMAEGFLKHYGSKWYRVYSAGFDPAPVHPLAVAVMAEVGVDISGQASLNNQTFFFVFLVLSQFFTLITLGHFFGKTMSTGRDVDLGYGK